MKTTALVPGSLSAVANRDNLSLAESFLSVDVLLVVDMSGSMLSDDAPGGIARHEAATAELRRLQASMPGKIGVIAFSSHTEFCPSGIPTPMFSGTDLAGALRFIKPADGLGIRIIIISDGQPDDAGGALAVARQFKSRIDTIYIGPEYGGGQEFLRKLAAASGGKFVKSDEIGMLAQPVTLLLAGR
jgi:Mg-chelatase subunit ChlD